MNEKTIRFLKEQGNVVPASGKDPFFVHGSSRAWVVLAGSMDVFVVQRDVENKLGARRYLFTVGSGEILLSFDVDLQASLFGMLAVGVRETEVIGFELRSVWGSGDPEITADMARLIDAFIAKVGALFAALEQKDGDVVLERGKTIAACVGSVLVAGRDVFWVCFEKGRCAYAGFDDLLLGTSFPLVQGLWAEVREEAIVSALSTAEVLAASPDALALKSLQDLCVRWLRRRIQVEVEPEIKRLRRRREQDERNISRSIVSLIDVMGEEQTGATREREKDEWVAALYEVGKVAGFEVKVPPRWEQEGKGGDLLEAVARASRVRSRRVALRGEWWETDSGPLLGFRADSMRPVAFIPTRPGRYEMRDPLEGKRVAIDRNVAEELAPFAYMFYVPFPDRPLKVRDVLLHAFAFVRRDYAHVLFVGIVGGLLGLAVPYVTGVVFSEAIPRSDRSMLFSLTLALVAAAVATTILELTRVVAFLRIQGRWGGATQAAVWDRLISLPAPFFRRYSVGDLAHRADGIDELREVVGGASVNAVLTGITSSFQFLLLFTYSLELALLAVALTSVFAAVIVVLSMVVLRHEKALRTIAGRLSGFVFQIVGGISKLRVAGAEKRAFALWAREFRDEQRANVRAGKFQNYVMIVNALVPAVLSFAVFWMIDSMASKSGETISVGAFVAFTVALSTFTAGAASFVETGIGMVRLVPMLERVKPILEAVPEVVASKPDPGKITGRLMMSHISHRYSSEGPLVLEDVSWEAAPGDFVAFVGPSGAGKSTLVRLLLGFEKPTAGGTYFDAHNVDAVDVTALRRQIGVVLQSSKLRAGTILENIVGSSQYTVKDAMRVAQLVGLDSDLDEMPMGLHTLLAEGGGTISGGQRQRILLARALVKRPRILILDEATSALDNRTQEVVSSSIEKTSATRIVIAHRLSTIRHADRIYVLERGRIVQQGTYGDLAAQEGLFRELVRRQEV